MTTKEKAAQAANRAAPSTAFDGVIVSELPKNSREVYRIIQREFKGYRLVDDRVRYDDRMSGELHPGKAGVTLKVEDPPGIVAALASLIDRGGET